VQLKNITFKIASVFAHLSNRTTMLRKDNLGSYANYHCYHFANARSLYKCL